MREQVLKRRAHSKLYDLGKGKHRLVLGQKPMHVKRDGLWLPIDLKPSFEAERGVHAVKDAPYTLRIDPARMAYQYNSPTGKLVEVALVGRAPRHAVDGEAVRWPGVAQDADYMVRAMPTGATAWLLLHSADAPRKWSWTVTGDVSLIRPARGHDAEGKMLELVETREDGTITVEWTGRAASRRALRKRKLEAWTTEIVYPVLIDPTVNEAITAGGDDAESGWEGGTVFYNFVNNATGLYIGNTNAGPGYSYQAGFRFQAVAVPAGVTIDNATLTLRVISILGTPDLTFFGNDVDDAAVWANPSNRIHNINKTTASATDSTWTSGQDNTVDVTDIVAEIVARPGWASGNDLAIAGFPTTFSDSNNELKAAALEHSTLAEPRLTIDYTEAGGAAGGAAAHLIGI